MITATVNDTITEHRIMAMNTYQTDSRGRRIAWARKHADWIAPGGEHRIGMTGSELARAVGVRNVTISYIENDHRDLSLPLLLKIAEVTGVTVGFLLMETDYPYKVELPPELPPEPVPYISPEADAAADLIDTAPPAERARMLAVLRTLAGSHVDDCAREDCGSDTNTQRRQFASRLVNGDKVRQTQAGNHVRS